MESRAQCRTVSPSIPELLGGKPGSSSTIATRQVPSISFGKIPNRLGSLIAACFALIALPGCGEKPPRSPEPRTPTPSTAHSITPWFTEASEASGLKFHHASGHQTRFYLPEMVTGGVAILDFNNDGFLDVFCVNGGSIDSANASPSSSHGLFRNLGGFKFENVTARSGLDAQQGYGMGCASGDFDGDGLVDLYVTQLEGGRLFRNHGEGRFSDVTTAAGINDSGWGTSAAFCDLDQDGDLDLVVVHYIHWSPAVEMTCHSQAGRPDYCSPMNYKAPAMDILFENLGNGRFTNITSRARLDQAYGNGLGVACADFSGDGKPDIFVANDGMPNQLWINQGGLQFVDEAALRGCAVSAMGMPRAGMGVAAIDLMQRGALDLFVTHLVGEGNGLFINSNGYFVDHLSERSVNVTSRLWTGFGVGFSDFNNDGLLDAYVANGRVKLGSRDLDPRDPYAEPNSLLKGLGRGEFEAVAPVGGTDPVLIATSRGLAIADLDNDGGVDVLVINRDGPLHLLRNTYPSRGNWVGFRVLNRRGGDALNARVMLSAGGNQYYREVMPNQSYCSSHDPRAHFGLGTETKIDSLTIRWPSGQTEIFPAVPLGQIHEVREGQGTPAAR